MMNSAIEYFLASPPEREDLVVQLFFKDGGQWGEVYRDGAEYLVELYSDGVTPIRLGVDDILEALALAKSELSKRLEAPTELKSSGGS